MRMAGSVSAASLLSGPPLRHFDEVPPGRFNRVIDGDLVEHIEASVVRTKQRRELLFEMGRGSGCIISDGLVRAGV